MQVDWNKYDEWKLDNPWTSEQSEDTFTCSVCDEELYIEDKSPDWTRDICHDCVIEEHESKKSKKQVKNDN